MYIAPPTSQNKFRLNISPFDLLWIILSPFIALGLRDTQFLDLGQIPFNLSPTFLYVFLNIFVSLPVFITFRINESLSHIFTARDALSILAASLISIIMSVFVIFILSRLEGIPRTVPFIHVMVLSFGLLLYRLSLRSILEKKLIASPLSVPEPISLRLRRIIVVGLDPFALTLVRLIEKQVPQTTQVICCFSLQGKHSGKSISRVRIYSNINMLGQIIDEYQVHGINIDEIWISDSSKFYNDTIHEFITLQTKVRGIAFKTISDALGLQPLGFVLTEKTPKFVYELPNHHYYSKIKRFLDIVLASVLFIGLLPIFIITLIITIFDIGSPTLFWQERLGRYGNAFRFYKIRTLGPPLDDNGLIVSDDKRLSRVGSLIRRSRIDEYPQLINIIVGDMSGIGPRPLLPRDQPMHKHIRLLIRPGITGWAQVNGAELLSADEKNFLDCWYVYNMSFWLDVKIVMLTIFVLIRGVARNEKAITDAKSWSLSQEYFKLNRCSDN